MRAWKRIGYGKHREDDELTAFYAFGVGDAADVARYGGCLSAERSPGSRS
jgi:hypothetical protein